jgi:HSP20 family molecular chaperone IbpA
MSGPNRTIHVAIGPRAIIQKLASADQIAGPARPANAISPLIDIHEEPEGLVLEADLPGASAETLSVQLEDNVLSLRAQTGRNIPEGCSPIHEEYPAGEYQRSFIIGDDVDRDRISAELKDGVLRLTLPKAERARTRKIEIKSS